MALYSETQATLRQSIARTFDDMVMGTAETNSTTNTVICSYLLKSDDYYNGWDCHFYEGIHAGQSREITDFNATSDTLTFIPVVVTAVATNDKFELHKKFTTEQYNDTINRSIKKAQKIFMYETIDETTALATNTYEYNVPSTFKYIDDIWIENATIANAYNSENQIDDRNWSILHGTTPKIKFDDRSFPIGSAYNGLNVRIHGMAMQAALSNDSDACVLPPEYVIQQSVALLHQQKGELERFKAAQSIAQNIYDRMIQSPPIGSRSVY